jgi:hypothetical protein
MIRATKTCLECDQPFEPGPNPRQVYCSARCVAHCQNRVAARSWPRSAPNTAAGSRRKVVDPLPRSIFRRRITP